MAILEASGKQEPEAKEAPTGPLEEVRACSTPHPQASKPHGSSSPPSPLSLRDGFCCERAGETVVPYSLCPPCCLP